MFKKNFTIPLFIFFAQAVTFASDLPQTKFGSTDANKDQKMQEYCKKYPNSTECKPTLVKQKLNSIQQQEDQKTEQKLKEMEN